MTTKPTSPQASQELLEALEKAISHYKKSGEDNERKAKVWYAETRYWQKEATTWRMLSAVFCATSIISIVLLISK